MHAHEVLLEKICESDIFHVEGSTQQRLFALKAAIDICLAQAASVAIAFVVVLSNPSLATTRTVPSIKACFAFRSLFIRLPHLWYMMLLLSECPLCCVQEKSKSFLLLRMIC